MNSTEGESSGNSNGNFSRQKLKKLQLHCDNFFSSCVSSIRYMFIFIFYLVYSWLILEYSNRGSRGAVGRSKSCKLLTHAKSFKQFAQFAMDCSIKS